MLEDPGDRSPVQVAHLRVGMAGLSDNTSLSFQPQESHADFSHRKERGKKSGFPAVCLEHRYLQPRCPVLFRFSSL